jgi:hypothetical protein
MRTFDWFPYLFSATLVEEGDEESTPEAEPHSFDKALDKVKEDFLTTIQTKFTDIVNNGRSIEVYFNVDKNSNMSYDKEVGTDGDLLSEVIMEWMKLNAYKNYAKKKHILSKLEPKLSVKLYFQNVKNFADL